MIVLVLAFWLTAALLVFTYAGYPVVLWLMVRARAGKASSGTVPAGEPSLSVVLVARNEESRIAARLANLAATNTPALREIILVCDGCTDGTAAVAEQVADARVRVLRIEPGRGKPAGVNAGVAAAMGEVVALCDARQRFTPETLPRLLAWFADPQNGAVSGALEIEPSATGAGQGVDAYWRLEKLIRRLESDLDSSVGCTGAVYAIRRSAFEPMPDDTLLDDVVVPMRIAQRGLRVRFCPEALAYDPQTLSGAAEQRRKIRTLGGNFQMLFRYPGWLLPWGHRLWWKLIAHKYLRLAGPWLLLQLLCLSWVLRGLWLPCLALVAQVAFYAAALLSGRAPGFKGRVPGMAAGFVFLQVCMVKGLFYWLALKPQKGWK